MLGRMDHEALLVTDEVAALLHVHPKQVYRLLARGLPGHRVGREWRFDRAEVLRWVDGRDAVPADSGAVAVDSGTSPPLLAANGDVAIEVLLARMAAGGGPILGFVQADRAGALELLRRGRVLLAGCHGKEPPEQIGDVRLARIHLVVREVGLAVPRGAVVPAIADLGRVRLAGRPPSAGIRAHLAEALRGLRADVGVLERATVFPSHREVAHAIVRGDADVGLVTRAWAGRLGLPFRALASEHYGLVVRASDLGDPRVVRLCDVAQSAGFRAELSAIAGYDAESSGAVQFHFAR